jgi:hypothetical protein
MPHSADGRNPISTLSHELHDHLNAYALAARSAGVAAIACALPAAAEIIYTPVHVNIAPHHSFRLDLNHDGIADFVISNYAFHTTEIWGHTLLAKPLVRNDAVAGVKGLVDTFYASAFQSGSVIGPARQFSGKLMAASGVEYGYVGRWQNATNRYLGLKFYINGQEHFGWARLSVKSGTGRIHAVLTGYAYETTAGKPIVAGKTSEKESAKAPEAGPFREVSWRGNSELSNTGGKTVLPTLGLLGVGAPALPIWRRRALWQSSVA